MRNIIVLLSVLFLSACSHAQTLPDEYVNCTHKYDSTRDILVKSEEDIELFKPVNCSEAVQDSTNSCPTFVRMANLNGDIVWLTSLQYENYVCRKQETSE